MTGKKKKSAALALLDKVIGEPITLGRFLRSHREDEGASLATLARELGISRQHLHAVERCKAAVSVERAIRWAEILGYAPELFVELVFQAEIVAAGLKLRVRLEKAA